MFDIPEQIVALRASLAKPIKMRCCKCKELFRTPLPERASPTAETAVPPGDLGEIQPSQIETAEAAGVAIDIEIEMDTESSDAPQPELVVESARRSAASFMDTREWIQWNAPDDDETDIVLADAKSKLPRPWAAVLGGALALVGSAVVALLVFSRSPEPFLPPSPEQRSAVEAARRAAREAERQKVAASKKDIVPEPEPATAPGSGSFVVSVAEYHVVELAENGSYLVVTGSIENRSHTTQTRIVLKGSLLDDAGQTRFEQTGTCGIVYRDERLSLHPRPAFDRLFHEQGLLSNCTIKPGQTRNFQLVFKQVPLDFGKRFGVEVVIASSRQVKEKAIESESPSVAGLSGERDQGR